MTASISVIIPYYNGGRFIAETLASVFNQQLAPLEIIVVDDGSRPEQSQLLDPFKDRVQVIHQQNTGVSGARNRGIAQARGEWIALLDQDDLWEPQKLLRQWDYVQQHAECDALHTAVKGIKTDGREVIFRKKVLGLDELLYEDPNPCYLSSTLIRRSALILAGAFNPTLRYLQDQDCFLRCARHFPFHYLDEVLTARRQHDENLSGNYLGCWQDYVRMARFYVTQYKDDADYRRHLHAIHRRYALYVITRRDFSALWRIARESARDGFSSTWFLLTTIAHVLKNKLLRSA